MNYKIAGDGSWILCLQCGRTSYNKNDVERRYCGACHVFHDSAIKIFTVAHVPTELAQRWLQHLRDFDVKHPGCHFEVLTEGFQLSAAEMVEMLRVEPGLTFTKIIEREKEKKR